MLSVKAAGPIVVTEGLPCSVLHARDVDGDGRVELLAQSVYRGKQQGSWQAYVSLEGEMVASASLDAGERAILAASSSGPPSLVLLDPSGGLSVAPWPWNTPSRLPEDASGEPLAMDLDGDGDDELVLGRDGGALVLDPRTGKKRAWLAGSPLAPMEAEDGRLLVGEDPVLGLVATGFSLAPRVPLMLRGLRTIAAAYPGFDWTGDGSNDFTLVGDDAQGKALLAVWAEGDLAFFRSAATADELLPLHQAPRALRLSMKGGPEVLVQREGGFEVLRVPDWESRLFYSEKDGVTWAMALPVSGPSELEAR
jgi:hypothetical protein